MSSELLPFAGAWLLWCLLHSLLISGPAAKGLQNLCGRSTRLIYNLLALTTLIPLLLWEYRSASSPLMVWPTSLWPLRLALFLLALWLVLAAARAFDLREFSGLSAFLKSTNSVPPRTEALVTSGLLSRVRHPWYSAGLMLLWLRDQDSYGLVSSAILTLYLLVGARLEERRLLLRFGPAYAEYRRSVPMFIPDFFCRKP